MKRHEHDCSKCYPLGEFGIADLYFCEQGGNFPTVIARYSSEGSDYSSGLPSILPDLQEAERRAKIVGLL